MAMLAEPRRRQKIGPNPRGNLFLDDENNRGREMLQKLGWQHGEGLGKTNQGMQAPIKPKVQNSAKGLGYDPKSDPWIAHTEEFADLLKNLEPVGICSEVKTEADAAAEAAEQKSRLERNSKSSKSRIHYHKFVKNKDVSNFSPKDLSCIFGKPTEQLGVKVKKEKSDSESDDETPRLGFGFSNGANTDSINKTPAIESSFQTINKGSMADYFSKRMNELKVKKEDQPEKEESKVTNGDSMVDYFKEMMAKRREAASAAAPVATGKDEPEVNGMNDENEVVKPSKKDKKRKQKFLEAEELASAAEENLLVAEATVEDPSVHETDAPAKKKSKKRKHRDADVYAEKPNIQEQEAVNELASKEQVPEKKKKKRDKGAKVGGIEAEKMVGEISTELPDVPKKNKDKKRKREQEIAENLETVAPPVPVENDSAVADVANVTEPEIEKKKSKKKKKQDKDDNVCTPSVVIEEPNINIVEEIIKPKKSKKRKHSEVENTIVTVDPVLIKQEVVDIAEFIPSLEPSIDETVTPKNSKKRKHKEVASLENTIVTVDPMFIKQEPMDVIEVTIKQEPVDAPTNATSPAKSNPTTPSKRHRKRCRRLLTAGEIVEVQQKFTGASLHKIHGYSCY